MQPPNGTNWVRLRGRTLLRDGRTRKLWIYDLRTNQHFTLKERTLKRSDLDEFVACCNTKDRTSRKESERFKSFTYEELAKRNKVDLDIFWLKDEARSMTTEPGIHRCSN